MRLKQLLLVSSFSLLFGHKMQAPQLPSFIGILVNVLHLLITNFLLHIFEYFIDILCNVSKKSEKVEIRY